MDKYEQLTKKGGDAYICMLESIGWFNNPYIDKEAIIASIKKCSNPLHFATRLGQMNFPGYEDEINQAVFEDCMDVIIKLMPNSAYELTNDGQCSHLTLSVGNRKYHRKIIFGRFVFNSGEDNFFYDFINKILEVERLEYHFYEIPPHDATLNCIYVKPEIYQKALNLEIIPNYPVA